MFTTSQQSLLNHHGREFHEMTPQTSRFQPEDSEEVLETADRDDESQHGDSGEAPQTIHRDDEPQHDSETLLARFLPLLALLPPTAAVIALLVTKNQTYPGELLVYIRDERASAQLVVQIISRLLAMLQMLALCMMLNFAVRLWLGSPGSATLQKLGFWSALSTLRLDSSLSSFYLSATVGFLTVSLLPGALWAGALSPIYTKIIIETEIWTPAYTNRTTKIWNSQYPWNNESKISDDPDNCIRINDKVFISSCPVPDLQGPILYSGSSATPVDDSVRTHLKLDNPIWQYRGRSYGVGSWVGLSNSTNSALRSPDKYYEYTETGYNVSVLCMKNTSSNFRLIYQSTPAGFSFYRAQGWLPNMYSAKPNGEDYEERFPVFSFHTNKQTNLATWTAHYTNSSNMIGVATGADRYTELNQTQCEVLFRPAKFLVAVNETESSISVEPQNSSAKDIEPTGQLQFVIMNSINFLARMNPSLYVSVLGDCLERNYCAKRKQSPNSTIEEAVTSSVAEAFTAMIDDILVAYGASQLLNAFDSITTPATNHVSAIRIGQPIYIYLIAALHFSIVSLWLFETVRTRGWDHLSKFDHLDIKSVIVASSAGGHQLGQTIRKNHQDRGSRWVGDKSDPIVAEMEIQLNRQPPETLDQTHEDNADGGKQKGQDMMAIVQKTSYSLV